MKKSISLILSLTVIILLNACSSVKVLDSWKADNIDSMNFKNILVIARTDNNQGRVIFEEEIANQLRAKGMKATESYTKFPQLNPDEKISEEKRETIITLLKNEGFNAVVLTVVKDVQETTKTVTDGGYYAGGTYASYYPMYYGGFYGYYRHPYSYSTYGNYVPSTSTTYTTKAYILETVIYNLDLSDNQQLVAVVTSKIDDPKNVFNAAKDYVKAIAKSFNNK